MTLLKDKTWDPAQAAKAQADYCEAHEMPMFAPADGWCNACGNNIYADSFSVEEAGKKLITGCPICHHSFVE